MSSSLPPTSAVSDVLAMAGMDGWMTPPLLPIKSPRQPVTGQALTIQLRIGRTGPGLRPLQDLFSDGLDERVLVVAGAMSSSGAVWGEIMSYGAQRAGAVAALVDGGVRDPKEVAELELLVYATDQRVAGPGGLAHVDTIGKCVRIGETTIESGDIVVLDEAGVVRVPAAVGPIVIDAALRYARAEAEVVESLRSGEPFAQAYRPKTAVVEALSAEAQTWLAR